MEQMKRIWKNGTGIMQMILILAVCILLFPAGAKAATLKVKYGESKHKFYKTINTVYVNGKEYDISKKPIYLKSGCYVGPASVIFKTGLKLSYKSSKKKLTLKNGDNKLVMKNGKKKATLNGKKTNLAVASWRVKYLATNKVYWVVPLKSVCKRLGLHYKLENGVIYIDKEADEDEEESVTTPSASASRTTNTSYSGKKIVLVIDAGHGGSDSGATAKWDKPNSIEKNMNLKIVTAAKQYFDKDPHFKVYYTRLTDTYPSLEARYQLANSKSADLFVSVHINSYKTTSTGTETLYSADRSPKTIKNGITSKELASCMQTYTRSATGFPNRGIVNRPKLKVLKYTKMPSCLIEYGFLSNKAEYKKMNSNYANYGRSLYNGIVRITTQHGLYK